MKHPAPGETEAFRSERRLALSRRQFLRGLGACIALPVFESSMAPILRAATTPSPAGPLAVTSTGAPLRMAYVYFPNGALPRTWWPKGQGSDYELNTTMRPLAPLRSAFQVVGGLNHKNAAPGNDGAGDHARANATFLTAVRARKTDSADIQAGISVDQLAAQQVGHLTRFSSLELSCENVRKSGTCDSGYSCAYQYNLSWASPSTPMTPEPNPRLVFERLFGSGPPAERQHNFELRQQTQKSLLDAVMDDTRALQSQLGPKDRDKLDEYLTGVRTVEERIQRAASFGPLPNPGKDAPTGIPANFGEHMDIMYDLMVMAFQTDSTRIATFLLSNDGSNRSFTDIGIPEGHHYCSHHHNDEALMAKVGQIDLNYMQHFARFLEKMNQTKDVDGKSLLHNSMIVYGCGNSDGNRHTHDNLPVILAGHGGGTLTTGRYAQYGSQPMANLFLNLTDRMGVRGLDRIGDSSGRLAVV